MRIWVRLLIFSSLSFAVFAQDRDFNGRWYLKPEKSDLQALPEAPETIMRIEQHSGVIHEFRVTGAGGFGEEIRTYSTEGKPTLRTNGETILNSQTKWEGAALLINIIVSAPHDSYSIADRWRMAKDGSRLTITRHIVRPGSETESTLVYEREPKAIAPPKLITNSAPLPAPPAASDPTPQEPVPAETASLAQPVEQPDFVVAQGTKIPLRLINAVDTKHSAVGDRVYLETVYPILSHGHVIIPPGSYVMGTLTQVQQGGRVKGKSSFFLGFDSLTLPNGTTRDFRSRMSGMDGDGRGSLDRKEGVVRGESGHGADARTMGTATAIGAGAGAAIGNAAGHIGSGLGIGAAAGALTGLAAVLASRGPDAILQRGTTVEMVLDRDLSFTREELGHR